MSFLRVLLEEFRAIFTNISVVFVVVVGSLLYAFLYPSPYKNDIVDSQKIAVVDLDNSSLSKELIFLVHSTPQVDVDYVLFSMKKAKELLEKGEIYGILEIPNGFESDVYRGIPSNLSYFANASYFLIYGAVIDGIIRATGELSDKIKLWRVFLEGGSKVKDTNLIERDSIPLFNPSVGYINYALAAILVFILHQTMIAGAGILGATQNQKNLAGIQGYWNRASALKLVLARVCAFSMIYIVFFLFYFGFLFQMYGIHIGADIVSYWCFALVFIFCCASFGVLLGLLVKKPAIPTQIILISSLPLIFMMGFIWPVELLPSFIVGFVHLIPAFHGINAFVRMNQMGADLSLVMDHFYWLLGLCICSIILCVGIITNRRKAEYLRG